MIRGGRLRPPLRLRPPPPGAVGGGGAGAGRTPPPGARRRRPVRRPRRPRPADRPRGRATPRPGCLCGRAVEQPLARGCSTTSRPSSRTWELQHTSLTSFRGERGLGLNPALAGELADCVERCRPPRRSSALVERVRTRPWHTRKMMILRRIALSRDGRPAVVVDSRCVRRRQHWPRIVKGGSLPTHCGYCTLSDLRRSTHFDSCR